MATRARRRRAERRKNSRDLRSIPLPQPGPQTEFVNTTADIAIYGGAAGAGKSGGLLIAAARDVANPRYGAVIFRRNFTQIVEQGALWDTAKGMFQDTGAQFKVGSLDIVFPSGAKLGFAHMSADDDRYIYQGSEMPFIGFDELTHFSDVVFWYMLSRNRTTVSGLRCVVRATCNPDADHWLRRLIDWWIGPDGYPVAERSGVIRYFVRLSAGEFLWGDSPEDLVSQGVDRDDIYSFTFIRGRLKDNQILMERDPRYKARLRLLHPVERDRLLGDEDKGGNWDARLEEGTVFDRTWFSVVDAVPAGGAEVAFWDFAATDKRNARKTSYYSARSKLKIVQGIVYILDIYADQIAPAEVGNHVRRIADQDGLACRVRWELEGGSAGKLYESTLVIDLPGYDAAGVAPMGDKLTRALPLATDACNGRVRLLRGSWNDLFLSAAQAFDGSAKPLVNDIIDATDGAYAVAKTLSGFAAAPPPTEETHSARSLRNIF